MQYVHDYTNPLHARYKHGYHKCFNDMPIYSGSYMGMDLMGDPALQMDMHIMTQLQTYGTVQPWVCIL